MLKTAFLTMLALQICLDRRGFSPNAMDGQCGMKTRAALAAYCSSRGLAVPPAGQEANSLSSLFPNEHEFFTTYEVTAEDLAALTKIPTDPVLKAKLPRMGYETLREMLAERSHVTENTLGRLNPTIDWKHVAVGTEIRIPEVSPTASGARASLVRISLSDFNVKVYDAQNRIMALFPCSIAKDKSKRPPACEMKVTTYIANPDYTYTPDFVPRGKKVSRQIFMPGPNNPVGTVWMGLSLPTYGIHGTPTPETIGRAESHGCFRLANWNAEKLYELVRPGTHVIIDP